MYKSLQYRNNIKNHLFFILKYLKYLKSIIFIYYNINKNIFYLYYLNK